MNLEEDPQGPNVWQKEESKNCISRRSQNREINLNKDKFDAVRRNPYSIMYILFSISITICVIRINTCIQNGMRE